jgi:hypothetical protein
VSELCHIPHETPIKYRDSKEHVDTYRCCVKSLIGGALVGFSVRQHARAESISFACCVLVEQATAITEKLSSRRLMVSIPHAGSQHHSLAAGSCRRANGTSSVT